MYDYESTVIQEEDLDSLEHYGIKGQKWGQRRYQNPDGSYTELGKERRRVGYEDDVDAKKEKDANANANGIETTETTDEKFGGKAYKDMTRKELRAAKKRARHNEKERRAQREFNRDKRAAIEEGDISFISENISKFSNDEIDEAVVRYNKMQTLKNLEAAKKNNGDQFVDKAIKMLEKGSKASKAFTEIVNNFNDMSKKSAERKKTQTDLDKAETELTWLKNPKSKPKSEKEELELKWLRDPKSKPKTEKEELDLKKQKTELNWFLDPNSKPQTMSELLDIEKKKLENKQKEEGIRSQAGIAEQNIEKGLKEKIDRQAKELEATESWKKYISNLSRKEAEQATWEKAVREEEAEAKKNSKFWFSGQNNNKSLTGWFSKKNKEDVKGTEFDMDDKRVNMVTRKYLNKLKDSPKDYFKENKVRNDQWKKDMKSYDADIIDDWVKDMKKKYMKEQKLSSKEAEKKAEAYVDSWLDAYDEGHI